MLIVKPPDKKNQSQEGNNDDQWLGFLFTITLIFQVDDYPLGVNGMCDLFVEHIPNIRVFFLQFFGSNITRFLIRNGKWRSPVQETQLKMT